MTANDYNDTRVSIMRHEGLSLKPIQDSQGSLSIGYGRNLTFTGISSLEAEQMLDHDLETRVANLSAQWPPFLQAQGVWQQVTLEMAYQLGVVGLLGFTDFLHALAASNLSAAVDALKQSNLAKQTPSRVADYIARLEHGA